MKRQNIIKKSAVLNFLKNFNELNRTEFAFEYSAIEKVFKIDGVNKNVCFDSEEEIIKGIIDSIIEALPKGFIIKVYEDSISGTFRFFDEDNCLPSKRIASVFGQYLVEVMDNADVLECTHSNYQAYMTYGKYARFLWIKKN